MRYADACRVLGLAPGTALPEVKKAYRKLAHQYHPDTNPAPEAQQQFRDVQQAYEVLTAAPALPAATTSTAKEPLRSQWPADRVPRAARRTGTDVTGNLRVTLQEVFRGTITDITFEDDQGCERCGATGAEPGSSWMPCPPCTTMPRGDCQWCAGAGQVPEEACRVCRGAGVEQLSRTVRVAVPRSARDGQVLRVTGKGRWGVQGRGDLRLTLKVEPQPHLRRLGDDLEADVTVGVLQAVLGGVAYVPSAEDRQYKIQVNPGSSSGKRYRIKGHGMYKGREGDARGDLFAVINIQVPDEKSLSEKERQLYRLLLEAETSRQAEMLEAEAQVD